eukprot:4825454-Alexandrium_andersonii.AAC.1
MSASLVGSEMCIRDRAAECLPVLLRARCQGILVRFKLWVHVQASACPGGCLLYTSDAADDM